MGRFAIEIIKLRKVSCLLSNAVISLISLHHYNWAVDSTDEFKTSCRFSILDFNMGGK